MICSLASWLFSSSSRARFILACSSQALGVVPDASLKRRRKVRSDISACCATWLTDKGQCKCWSTQSPCPPR